MTTSYPALAHASRTVEKLVRLLPEADKIKPQIIFLIANHVSYRNDTDRELSFRQESNFFYLTGCNVPESMVLVVTPGVEAANAEQARDVQTILFIPPEDPLETMWSPPPPSLKAAADEHTASKFEYTTNIIPTVARLLAAHPTALVHTLPASPLFPSLPVDFTENFQAVTTPSFVLSALHLARLIKTPQEVELIRKANAISSRAHELIMRLLGKHARDTIDQTQKDGVLMPSEWRIEKEAEAEAVFVASCRREGSLHQAYLPIVASAQRASTLHYCCNDRDFAWGPIVHDHTSDIAVLPSDGGKTFVPQVLLLDAGCEWNNYASDITRTTPIGNGGKFTQEARDIYSLVLKMQNEAIESLKPGLHWDTVHHQCHVTLVNGFKSLGIFKGEFEDILASGVSAAFFPHGVGHSLGMDVHDVPSASKPDTQLNLTIPDLSNKHPKFHTYLRLRLPLEAGMVLTVEPGIYFSPHLLAPVRNSEFIDHEVLARYESVGGVRIEDVLVITSDGCENLTTVGKEVDWIERLCSGDA